MSRVFQGSSARMGTPDPNVGPEKREIPDE